MSRSFLDAATARFDDTIFSPYVVQHGADELAPSVMQLGADELSLVASAVTDPETAARMSQVSRLWRRIASSESVWGALADSYWFCRVATSTVLPARSAVSAVDGALRGVACGRQRFAILIEQDGQVRLPTAYLNDAIRLRLAPFRILVVFGGSRPVCSISLCSSDASTTYDLAADGSGRPLAAFTVDRNYEEEWDEADAVMFWEAASSPGPGLLLDCARHQCIMWDLPERFGRPKRRSRPGAPRATDSAEGPGAPLWCWPPWQGATPHSLVLCVHSVSRVKPKGDSEWRSLKSALLANPSPSLSTVDAATARTRPIYLVASHQQVSVDSCETHPRQRERQRERVRIDWCE